MTSDQGREIEIQDESELPSDAREVTQLGENARRWVCETSLDTYILRNPPMQWSHDGRFPFG